MAATDAMPVPRKNAAYRHYFTIRKNDGTLITTWAGADSERSIDGAAYADCTNEATEIGTSGTGYIDLTASEMNADCVMLKIAVTNTDALTLVVALFPQEAGDIQSTTEAIATGAVTADAIATDAITAGKIAADAIGASELATTAISEVATAILGAAVPGIYGAGSLANKIGNLSPLDAAGVRTAVGLASANLDTQLSGLDTKIDTIDGVVDAILVDTGTTLPATLSTIAGYIDTEVAAIKAVTDALPDAGALTSLATAASLAAVEAKIDTIDGIAEAILLDTAELQANQGDWLTATGFATHSAADVWGVATRVLTAGTNIVLAKGTGVTGFNDLSAADVNAQADLALADYDGPTKAEMDAAFTEIKGPTFASTDTLEAIRDRGDAAWTTGAGGGGGGSSAADIWGYAAEDGVSFGQIVTGLGAVMLGRTVVQPNGLVVFRSVDDSRNAVTMTLASDGSRSEIILALSS